MQEPLARRRLVAQEVLISLTGLQQEATELTDLIEAITQTDLLPVPTASLLAQAKVLVHSRAVLQEAQVEALGLLLAAEEVENNLKIS